MNTTWQSYRAQILAEFTVTGSIAVGADNFNEFAGSGVEDGSSFRQIDKHTARLAQLESKAAKLKGENVVMTQAEYIDHVKNLSADLDRAWSRDERVTSLKLAIQVSKNSATITIRVCV